MTHDCAILAVDPGESSGWAVWLCGELRAHGPAVLPIDRQLGVTRAFSIARTHAVPLIVVAEKWGGRRWNPKTARMERLGDEVLVGLGAHWGRWLEQLDLHGGYTLGRSKWPKIVRVLPTTWQPAMLGRGRSEQLKSASVTRATAQCHAHGLDRAPADDNVADAICIGEWACKATEVGALLPKRKAA